MGLSELSLGFEISSADKNPSVKPTLEEYLTGLATLPGAQPAKPMSLRVYHFSPHATIQNRQQIAEILAQLAGDREGSG